MISLDFYMLVWDKLIAQNTKSKVKSSNSEIILGQLYNQFINEKIKILAPVAHQKKGEFQKEIRYWESKGFVRARIDGKWVELCEIQKLAKTKPHSISVLVDQIKIEEQYRHRIKKKLKPIF